MIDISYDSVYPLLSLEAHSDTPASEALAHGLSDYAELCLKVHLIWSYLTIDSTP